MPNSANTTAVRSGTAVMALLLISGVINLLALSGAVYMLQVYDRVLTSHNLDTLIALSVLVAGLYFVLGALEVLRSQILLRLGTNFSGEVMPRAIDLASKRARLAAAPHEALQPVRDTDTIRVFLASPAPTAVFDLPWAPIFLIFVWLLSPSLGLLTLAGLIALIVIGWITDLATRTTEQNSITASLERHKALEAALRNAEAARAMGFASELTSRFLHANDAVCNTQTRSSDIVSALAAVSKVIRLMLQSAILGLGAYFAMKGDISAGAIFAASIAAARALAPAEMAIANWRSFAVARQSYRSLKLHLGAEVPQSAPVALPRPNKGIALENASVVTPGERHVVLNSVSLTVQAGQGLAVIGRSGSGKSTLARSLVGITPLARGHLHFDAAPVDRWLIDERGHFIGYMPQTVELFPGTIAENIARLNAAPESQTVISAARAAGLHDIILKLPDGYETVIETGGAPLSAGQRQQLGLARALYGDPFLIVLDEPNANLDSEAEGALIAALKAARQRGAVVIVVAHRRNLLAACDLVAVLDGGHLTAFGAKDTILESTVVSVNSRHKPGAAARLENDDTARRMTT